LNEVPAEPGARPAPAGARSGLVALVGRANVGKSTLMNRVLGEKVSIVSDVVQTTRNLVRGVLTEERGQLAFLDTPGIHKAQHDLGRIMNRTARAAIKGSDVALMLVDGSSRPREEDEGWLRRLTGYDAACVIACNKSDQGTSFLQVYRDLWEKVAMEKESVLAPRWMTISARDGSGIEALVALLFDLVPEGPALFPADVLTDFPRNWTIADVVREKLFAQLKQELPHAVAVKIDSIDESDDRWNVRADVLVDRPSQKGIVIGHKGRLLRTAKRQAEAELSEMYERTVNLELWVKVERNWAQNHWILKQLGYV